MYTQCPHCDAVFQLSTAQLKAANGEVRCGQCLTVFNALNHLSDDIPATAAESAKKPTDEGEPNGLWADENLAASSTENAITEPATDTIESTVADNDDGLPDISPEVTPIDSEFETAIDVTSEAVVEETLVDEALVSTTADATTNTIETETSAETADADIFSEIIAQASQHAPPTEAIDRFEEFLSDDTPTPLHANADTSSEIDSDIDNELAELANEFDTATIVSNETSSADEFSDTNLDDSAFAAPALGEVEAVTAELDTDIHIDTADEFAEFDDYLQSADDATDEKTNEFTVSLSDDSAEFDSLAVETTDIETTAIETTDIEPADSGNTFTKDVDTGFDVDRENDLIIIEEADLEPISSAAYTDRPEAKSEDSSDIDTSISTDALTGSEIHSDTDKTIGEAAIHNPELDDFSELAEAAAEVVTGSESISVEASASTLESGIESTADETRQASHNIPALILEDLHAAKAEQLRPSNAPWVIGSLLLMLTLVLQVVYHSRDELAKDASLRPWLIQMCQYANCTLTQPYDIKQIDIIGREVRSHPSARKALIASTTLINNANFVQPFPLLTVVFSDINGKPMAQRRFTPREYLSSSVDLAAGMTPDLPVRIELELVDPGKAAVNYEFQPELDPRNTRPLT